MIKKLISPVYLLPLFLVSPYIFMGPYGVTVVEALIVLVFMAFALPALIRGSFALPKFLLIYLTLFLVGWLGAVLNGMNWGIPVGLWNLNFFYKVVLAIGGYYIGYRVYQSMDKVVTHRFFRVVIIGLAIIAALYPFLTYDQRLAILKIFYASGDDEIRRLRSARFPGLGINANIYSFMVFSFLLFSFDAYLRKLVPAILPLLAFIVIFAASSKLVISLSVVACLLLLAIKLVSVRAANTDSVPLIVFSKRALSVVALVAVFLSASFVYLMQTSVGNQIVETVETFDRLSNVLTNEEGQSALNTRTLLWERGLERVNLAPVLGIVRHRYAADDFTPLLFAHPHNEFIAQWMFYGIFGMVAHIFLLGTLIIVNLRQKAERVWPVLYLALIGHMLFDGAFEYVRFYAMFFMIVGMNMQYLKLRRTANLSYR